MTSTRPTYDPAIPTPRFTMVVLLVESLPRSLAWDPSDEELDAGWLVWRLHQSVVPDNLPDDRTVVHFVLEGPGGAEAWLVLDRGGSTACQIDPGVEVDLVVMGDNREVHRWLLDWRTFRDLRRTGSVRFIGPSRLGRHFAGWFRDALFSDSYRAAGANPESRAN